MFQISADFKMPSSPQARWDANVEAIATLKNAQRLTRQEKQALIKFSGSGSVKQIFDPETSLKWAQAGRDWMKQNLSQEEYEAAYKTQGTAFYTSPEISSAMWEVLNGMGFQSGKILSLSAGTGIFTATHPDAHSSEWHLCEIDPTPAAICRSLYPEATVYNQGFETLALPDEYFDLVIDNFPFGADVLYEPRYNAMRLSIHNHAIIKALDKLRPGGILACITTHYTMDALTQSDMRQRIADQANLEYFCRLPVTAHADAGTSVSSDILIFRKRREDDCPVALCPTSDAWINVIQKGWFQGQEGRYAVSPLLAMDWTIKEFVDLEVDEMYFGGGLVSDLKYVAIKNLKSISLHDYILGRNFRECYKPVYESILESDHKLIPPHWQDLKALHFCKLGNESYQRLGDILVRTPDFDEERYNSFNELSDAIETILRLQQTCSDDNLMLEHRATLAHLYECWVSAYGDPKSRNNQKQLGHLPFYPAIASLVNDSGQRSDIFYHSTARAYESPELCETSHEAFLHCLNTRGGLDIEWITDHLKDYTDEKVTQELSARNLIHFDFLSKAWVCRDEFLSGNVKHKLNAAKDAAVTPDSERVVQDWVYEHNKNSSIPELTAVQPLPAVPDSTPQVKAEAAMRLIGIDISTLSVETRSALMDNVIQVRLGTSWISTDLYEEFFKQLLSDEGWNPVHIDLTVSRIGGAHSAFFITANYSVQNSHASTSKYGTPRMNGVVIAENAMNQIDPRIYDITHDDITHDDKRVLNVEATEQVRQKSIDIKEAFKKWIWSDEERCYSIAQIYNDRFVGDRIREYDGIHLQFPGSNPDVVLRKHQRNAVWRGIQEKSVLLGHVVGSGKAQALDSKILTPTGWKLMGDIRVGNKVITQDGTPTEVTGVFPQGEKEIFKVTMSDGSSTKCCDEHLWLTQTYAERNSASSATRLGKNWECARPKVRTLSEIRKALKSSHLAAKNHSIPIVEPVQFIEQKVELDAYVFGVILGDGCIRNECISISNPEDDLMQSCEKLLPDGVRLNLRASSEGKCPTYGIVKTEGKKNSVTNWLRQIGVMGLKSVEKHIPDVYKFNSIENRLKLLRGLMDTDGWVDLRGSSSYFTTSSPQLAADVEFIVQSLGGTVSTTTKTPKYFHDGEQRTGFLAFSLCIKMPPSTNPFSLPRKADLVKAKTKYKPVRYIVSVESVGVQEAQCISVAHESRLYVTDDFIVTHNTLELICLAMELRRLNICSKPIIGVLKSTIGQFEASFRFMYPQAKVLVSTEKDFEKEHRRKFLSRIATGDWDAVILTHQQLQRIPMSIQYQKDFIRKELHQLNEYRKENSDDRKATKMIDKAKKKLEHQMKKLIDGAAKDSVIDFELLGCDALFLDEFQVYKNLHFYTKQNNIAGLTNRASLISMDMYLKLRYVKSIPHGRIIGATGTPITNTISELFTLQRYFQAEELEQREIESFDSWASVFGETQISPEITPTGLYKVKTRFAKFCNLPELLTMFWSFADIQTAQMLNLPVPKAEFKVVAAPPSEQQLEYMQVLCDRADAIQARMVKPDEDNMLKVCTDGRKSSIDIRMISPIADNFILSKINQAALNIFKIWESAKDLKALQLVFCDFSTPNVERFNVYDYIRHLLIMMGVPSVEIAAVHDANNNKKKLNTIFEKANRGEVRILMGSTVKLGTGVNVQERVVAMHHIDAPWRPSDMEQREGRGIRQGNIFKKIWIFRYVTEGANQRAGFDSFLFQLLETKMRFISQIMAGQFKGRATADMDDAVLSFSEVKAIASGDPMIQRKTNLENQQYQLEMRYRSHCDEQASSHAQLLSMRIKLNETMPRQIRNLQLTLDFIAKNVLTDEKQFWLDHRGKKVAAESMDDLMQWVNLRATSITEKLKMTSGRGYTTLAAIGDVLRLDYQPPAREGYAEDFYLIVPRFDVDGQPIPGSCEFSISITRYRGQPILTWERSILPALDKSIFSKLESIESEIDPIKLKIEAFAKEQGKPFAQQEQLESAKAELVDIYEVLREKEDAAITATADVDGVVIEDEDEECEWLHHSGAAPNTAPTKEFADQVLEMDIEHFDWIPAINSVISVMSGGVDPDAIKPIATKTRKNVIKRPVRV